MAPFDTTTARGCSQKPPLTTQAALGASQACPSYLLQVNILSLFPLLESLPTWPLGCHGGVKTQYLFDSTCHIQATQHVLYTHVFLPPGIVSTGRVSEWQASEIWPSRYSIHYKSRRWFSGKAWLRALGKAKRSPFGNGSLGESKPLQACLGPGQTKDPWLLSMTVEYTNKSFYHAVSFKGLYAHAACISARAALTASPPSAMIET